MRKLAVSVVTLTSLTACTQGSDLGTNWSFELPKSTISEDEQFARFGEQNGSDDLDAMTATEPTLPELSPGFTDGPASMPIVPGPELAVPKTGAAEMGAVPPTMSSPSISSPAISSPAMSSPVMPETEGSDLSIDELLEFTFPQRGPRPNPLARVRFSPTGPQASNQYIERIMGAADITRQSRPVSVSRVAPPSVTPEPTYLRSIPRQNQSDLSPTLDSPGAAELPVFESLLLAFASTGYRA